jgi:hypothetical protein
MQREKGLFKAFQWMKDADAGRDRAYVPRTHREALSLPAARYPAN